MNGSGESFSTKYFYDDFDRVAKVVSPAGEFSYEYDSKGQTVSVKGPGYEENRVFDKAGRLLSKTLNGQQLCSYEYDAMNRRTKATVNGVSWEYKYDEFGQLLFAKPSEGKSYDYNYDKIGNNLSFNGSNFSFNKLNQFANGGFAYDAYGNMTATPDGWKYTWDAQNRLVKAEKGTKKAEFSYDFMSRRVARKVSEAGMLQVSEKFLFDGFNMTVKFDLMKKDSLQQFSWNGQELLSSTSADGKSSSYIKDGNKNVVALLDKGGAIATQYAYSPFGEAVSIVAKDDANPYRFSSEQWDSALGLAYYNYRYYSPVLGKWLGRDPIGERGRSPVYVFVANTPTNHIDYYGMWNSDVHYTATRRWAIQDNYPDGAAEVIATYDDGVDGGGLGLSLLSPAPVWGDQSYHFNRHLISGGQDTRLTHFFDHLKNAKDYCYKNRSTTATGHASLTDSELAIYSARELGVALHPLQDIQAHGNYGFDSTGKYIWERHNKYSPQTNLLTWNSDVGDYPDDTRFDAIGGTNGIPDWGALKQNGSFIYSPYYADYEFGTKRIDLTHKRTNDTLNDFRKWIRLNGTCACRQFFGVIDSN